jgi:23S rRNA (cytosine1962-C5)-methyltransferase
VLAVDKVFLRKGRERSIGRRHPWVFSGAVERVDGAPAIGATVAVADCGGTVLGYGSWSPQSQIRVRMLSFSADLVPDGDYVRGLVSAAIARRSGVDGISPTAEPHRGVRLVHGESDGLPGVVVDSYDGWCVVQCASAGAEHFRGDVVRALMESGAKGVFNRSDVDSRKREGLPEDGAVGMLAGEEPPELIEIHEGSIRYLVDVRKGHKTGFYLDQREARAQVGAYAAGREVLNCFSYTGGFGLACAAGGAGNVINLDLSKSALQLAERNFELLFSDGGKGGVSRCPVDFCCADVFKQLRLYRDQGRQFDLIVLDPPKFADTKAQLLRAARGYKDINLLAMKLLRPGGVLATFSCSGAMTAEFFDTVCREAACDAGRDFQIVARTRQAEDHPTALAFTEGEYLKGLILCAV